MVFDGWKILKSNKTNKKIIIVNCVEANEIRIYLWVVILSTIGRLEARSFRPAIWPNPTFFPLAFISEQGEGTPSSSIIIHTTQFEKREEVCWIFERRKTVLFDRWLLWWHWQWLTKLFPPGMRPRSWTETSLTDSLPTSSPPISLLLVTKYFQIIA